MKKNFRIKCLIALMLLSVGLMASLVTAHASPNQSTLRVNKSYTTTLTGSQKHKVKYTTTNMKNDDKALNLYIDGKKVQTIKKTHVKSWNIRLITVSSGRTLIYVKDSASNGYNYYMNIYEYKNKKLTSLGNLVTLTRNTGKSTNKYLTPWARGLRLSVKPNTLIVRWCDATSATGYYYQDITYKISGNKITRSGSAYTLRAPNEKATVKWTATRSFDVYQGVGNGEKVFSVKAGDKVTGLKVTSRMGTVFFYIKNADGRAGWFDVPNAESGAWFKEAKFAS